MKRLITFINEKIDADHYNVGSEKSQFGGYRPHVTHKKSGHTMYLGSDSYKSPEHAKGHAHAYLKGYEAMNDKHAERKANEYRKANSKHLYKEEVELDEKAYVSSMSPELGRKGSHDVVGKDGKVVKSYPYTKDGMKAAQAHLSKMKEAVELDELAPETMDRYSKKAKMSSDRARNSATAKLVRGNDDISKEKDTIRKREKGMKMADRGQVRAWRKEMGYDKK